MNPLGRFIVTVLSATVAFATCGCKTMEKPTLSSITSLKTPELPDAAALAPVTVYDHVQGVFKGPAPNRDIALASFAQAEKTFDAAAALPQDQRKAEFRKAIKPYQEAATNAPNTTVEEDALMMVAEAHFFAEEYPKAAESYDALIKKYPRTRHLDQIDQRRFSISQYWLGLEKQSSATKWLPNVTNKQRPMTDTFGFATKNLDKIRFDNPTGKLADDATMAAAIANYQKRKFGQADILFADIRDNFPSSEHQFRAHMLGLKCKQAMYRGPDYSAVPLNDADKIVKQIYKLFPKEADANKEELERIHKNIRLQKAVREYKMAEYYDNRSEFGAAQMYYGKVKEEYNDTSLAVESDGRIKTISKFAPTPGSPLGWLADLFPEENTRVKPLLQREAIGVAK